MNNITNLTTIRRERRRTKAQAMALCRSGLHRWEVVKDQPFKVHSGKLVTFERCTRCDAERSKLK